MGLEGHLVRMHAGLSHQGEVVYEEVVIVREGTVDLHAELLPSESRAVSGVQRGDSQSVDLLGRGQTARLGGGPLRGVVGATAGVYRTFVTDRFEHYCDREGVREREREREGR